MHQFKNSRAVSPLAKGSNTTTVVVRAVENKMIFYKASLLYIAAGLCRITQINLCIHHGHNAHTIFYLHHCLHSHSGRPYPRCPYLPLSLFVLWKINDYFYQASRLLTVCIYCYRCPQWTSLTVCIYCYRCPQWTSVTVCIYCYRCPQWTSLTVCIYCYRCPQWTSLTVCIYCYRCPQWTSVTVCIYCYRCPQWTSVTVCIYCYRCPQWTSVTVCIYCYRCPQWTSDEKLAARNVNNEVQFYENNNFGQYKLCPVYTGTPPRALFVNLELTFF